MDKILVTVLPLGELQANCYLVRREGSKNSIVIDPGDDYETLKEALDRLSLIPRHVLLTHGHFDHMLCAAHLKSDFGAKICISEKDEIFLSDKSYNLCPDTSVVPFVSAKADLLLSAGDYTLSDIDFTVIETPGHTPGGVCYYLKDEQLLFSGDTLFSNGFGRTDFKGGDWAALFKSLKTLFQLPPGTLVYPGHGEHANAGDIRKGFYR